MTEQLMDDVTKPAEPQISKIGDKYNPDIAAQVPIEAGVGVVFQNLPQLIQGAQLMARADICLPIHCRQRPEICFAILMRSQNWRLRDPFFVAEHSYVVKKWDQASRSEIETLAFDASVFHAVIAANAPIQDVVEYEYDGAIEDQTRTCTASVTLLSGKRVSHTSPPLSVCHPGFREKDGVKYVRGSPLWQKNPDQQLAYFTVRDLARKYFPHILGGVYDRDEFEETPVLPENRIASPGLIERLAGKIEGEGFAETHADQLEEGVEEVTQTRKRPEKAAGAVKGVAGRVAKPQPAKRTGRPLPNIPSRSWGRRAGWSTGPTSPIGSSWPRAGRKSRIGGRPKPMCARRWGSKLLLPSASSYGKWWSRGWRG